MISQDEDFGENWSCRGESFILDDDKASIDVNSVDHFSLAHLCFVDGRGDFLRDGFGPFKYSLSI